MDRLTMRRLGYVPALDGLRGVAIALVIASHYFGARDAGSVGVSLFFLLSGFLITTLLLEERAAKGRIRLRAFYARRARRLFPALAVMLAAYLAGAAVEGREPAALRAVAAGGFYTANVTMAYWPRLIIHESIVPLWSLAEEEQFYLVWPAVLILVLAAAWRTRRVKMMLVAAILLIWAERFWLHFGQHASYERLQASPESAADCLLVGVLLAFILKTRRPGKRLEDFTLVAVIVLGMVAWISPSPDFYRPVIDVAGAVIVALAVQPDTLVSRVLSWRPLVWLGLISYSLYLWHLVVLSWLGEHDRGAALVFAVGIAWLSYRYVETRFRRCRLDPLPDVQAALAGGAAAADLEAVPSGVEGSLRGGAEKVEVGRLTDAAEGVA